MLQGTHMTDLLGRVAAGPTVTSVTMREMVCLGCFQHSPQEGQVVIPCFGRKTELGIPGEVSKGLYPSLLPSLPPLLPRLSELAAGQGFLWGASLGEP